jgi:hypothetical protein
MRLLHQEREVLTCSRQYDTPQVGHAGCRVINCKQGVSIIAETDRYGRTVKAMMRTDQQLWHVFKHMVVCDG